ncbi:MAG: ATP-binding protein [Bacteroidota bacterium]
MRGLRYRIAFGFLVVVLIGLATNMVAVYNFSVVNREVGSILQDGFRITLSAQNMVRSLERQENAQLAMLLDDPDLAYVQFTATRVGFLGWHEEARLNVVEARDLALLDTIARKYRVYNFFADSLYRILQRKGGTASATAYKFQVVRPFAESLKEDCFELLERSQTAISQTEETIRSTIRGAMLTVILASIGAVVLSIVASSQFIRSLQPLETLTRSVRLIGRGHLNQKIDVVGTDEIGELSMEFNKMTERLRLYEESNIHTLITEKKRSETIVASIADPVVVTNDLQQVLLMNSAAEHLFGLPRRSWEGSSLAAAVRDERWIDVLLGRRSDREDTLMAVERGGRSLYFRPRRTVITDEQGIPQGTVTLLQDVTRFKDLDRMKSEFVATVSHELRTPLTSLNMSVDILLQEVLGRLTERQRELITASKDDVERLRKLVHDLLELARLESGRQEIHKESIHLRDLVDDALKPLRLPFGEKRIALEVGMPDDLPPVSVDRRQFTWVVTNLASNSLRFTSSGGTVRFSAIRQAGGVQVAVADTGKGIPANALEHIFDKFVQVQEGDDTNPGSVGLGLAIARGVVEAHGGTIWVESQVDRGTTFYFTIPFA